MRRLAIALAVLAAAHAACRARPVSRDGGRARADAPHPGATQADAAASAAPVRPPGDDPALGLAGLCARARVPCPPRAPHARVEKAARTLTLLDGPTPLARFPVALGPHPEGPKLVSGDGKTPEGKLHVVTRNARSRFHLFLGLSYPTADDAARGVREGLIDARTADKITAADRDRSQPPWDTKLGGEVGIHGHGSAPDWTAGCVALEDAAIEVLWEALPMGAEIEIAP